MIVWRICLINAVIVEVDFKFPIKATNQDLARIAGRMIFSKILSRIRDSRCGSPGPVPSRWTQATKKYGAETPGRTYAVGASGAKTEIPVHESKVDHTPVVTVIEA